MKTFTIITTIILIILGIITIITKKKKDKIKKGDFVKFKNNDYSDGIVKCIKINKNIIDVSIQYETLSGLTDPIFKEIDMQLLEKI